MPIPAVFTHKYFTKIWTYEVKDTPAGCDVSYNLQIIEGKETDIDKLTDAINTAKNLAPNATLKVIADALKVANGALKSHTTLEATFSHVFSCKKCEDVDGKMLYSKLNLDILDKTAMGLEKQIKDLKNDKKPIPEDLYDKLRKNVLEREAALRLLKAAAPAPKKD